MVPLLQRVTFGRAPKVTKSALPHHSAPRLGSVCPHSGIAPWAAAKGHPWPSAAIPASMPGCPLRNACVRPAWLTGRPRSKAKAKQKRGTSSIYVAAPSLSRASSLPHSISSEQKIYVQHKTTVGASLLAKRPAHPISSLAVKPPSRAGSFPQEKRVRKKARSAVRPPRF